jgi:hypothetical protein
LQLFLRNATSDTSLVVRGSARAATNDGASGEVVVDYVSEPQRQVGDVVGR